MIIYDDRIKMEVGAFKDVLQARNSILDNELSITTTINFFFDNIFGVFQNSRRLVGRISVEKISRDEYHVQVMAEDGSPDYLNIMTAFTWMIIESYKGAEAAKNWRKNVDKSKFEAIKIPPVLTEFYDKNGEFFHLDDNNVLSELSGEKLPAPPAGNSLFQIIDPDPRRAISLGSSESQEIMPQPWEQIEDNTGNDKYILNLWWAGYDRGEIAKKVHLAPDTITNRITELRKKWGKRIVPLNKERKRKLLEGRDTP